VTQRRWGWDSHGSSASCFRRIATTTENWQQEKNSVAMAKQQWRWRWQQQHGGGDGNSSVEVAMATGAVEVALEIAQ